MIVALRRHTLLPLDDCHYALQPSIPHLTRSALHRCLQRHGISRLPDVEGDTSDIGDHVGSLTRAKSMETSLAVRDAQPVPMHQRAVIQPYSSRICAVLPWRKHSTGPGTPPFKASIDSRRPTTDLRDSLFGAQCQA